VLAQFTFFETCYNFLKPLFDGEMSISQQAGLMQAMMSHMWANQARYGIELRPTRISIEPFAFVQQAMAFAGMIRP
jgi:hypothetical protein